MLARYWFKTEILVHKEIIKITITKDLKFVPVTFMQINRLHSKIAVPFFFSKIFINFSLKNSLVIHSELPIKNYD